MSKSLIGLEVKGRTKSWGFAFYGDPKHIPEWRADGLEVSEIEILIPVWVLNLGLARAWCFVQDLWNFKNPFRP